MKQAIREQSPKPSSCQISHAWHMHVITFHTQPIATPQAITWILATCTICGLKRYTSHDVVGAAAIPLFIFHLHFGAPHRGATSLSTCQNFQSSQCTPMISLLTFKDSLHDTHPAPASHMTCHVAGMFSAHDDHKQHTARE